MFFSPAVDELSLRLSGAVAAACDTFYPEKNPKTLGDI